MVGAEEKVQLLSKKGAKGRLVLARKTKRMTKQQKHEKNVEKAIKFLGEESFKDFRSQWEQLDSGWGGTDRGKADGIIISLIKLGMPNLQIRACLGCGIGRICRLRDPEHHITILRV